MSKINSLIIIPTYNESDNIIDLINEIFLLDEDFHILVVDDNSLDKTASLVDEKIKTSSDKLFILKRKSMLEEEHSMNYLMLFQNIKMKTIFFQLVMFYQLKLLKN